MESEVKKAVRNARRDFKKKLSKNSKYNSKPFYSYLKNKFSNWVSVGPLKETDDNDDETSVTDDEHMCEILNQFFSSVFTREDTVS